MVRMMMRILLKSENEENDTSKNIGWLLLTLVEKPYMTKTENLREYFISSTLIDDSHHDSQQTTSCCVLHEGKVQVVDLIRVYMEGK
jgi:hypothetical protein